MTKKLWALVIGATLLAVSAFILFSTLFVAAVVNGPAPTVAPAPTKTYTTEDANSVCVDALWEDAKVRADNVEDKDAYVTVTDVVVTSSTKTSGGFEVVGVEKLSINSILGSTPISVQMTCSVSEYGGKLHPTVSVRK